MAFSPKIHSVDLVGEDDEKSVAYFKRPSAREGIERSDSDPGETPSRVDLNARGLALWLCHSDGSRLTNEEILEVLEWDAVVFGQLSDALMPHMEKLNRKKDDAGEPKNGSAATPAAASSSVSH